MNIIFMGRKKYAAQMLEWTVRMGHRVVAVVTDAHFANSSTMKAAQNLSIPVMSLEEAQEIVADPAQEVDLVISYLFWKKIKEPMISTPRLGCINFHPAILPDWKGTAGYNVAILNKLPQWGASAHFVDETIDTGKIIRVYRFDFDYRQETAQSLEKKTQEKQMELYKSVLLDLEQEGTFPDVGVANTGGVYISKKQMLEMMKIDLEKDDVPLKIRAFWFPPYHGAYVEIQGKKYTLVDDFILRSLQSDDQTAL